MINAKINVMLFCFIEMFLSMSLERVICLFNQLALEYGRLIKFIV